MPLDGQIAPRTQPRAGLMLAAVSAVLLGGGIALAAGARLVGTQSVIDGSYWALGIAVAAAIALWAGMRPRSTVSPVFGGLAIATDTISAAFFLALAGGIFALGHDGLAVAIGLGAGCLLMQLVVAPGLAASGARSLPQFFAARYPGRAAGILCALVTVVSMLLLLAAELMAAGLVGARLLGVDFTAAAVVSACAVLACFIVRGASSAPWANGVLFPAMLLAVLAPLVVLSVQWYGIPIPQLAYGHALGQVQSIEQTLLEQELADPAVMKPMLTAFVTLTPVNFLGIVLGLAAGVAVLPSMLPAQLTAVPAPTGAPRGAVGARFRRRAPDADAGHRRLCKAVAHPVAGGPNLDRGFAGVDLHLRKAGAGRNLRASSDRRSGGRTGLCGFARRRSARCGCRTSRSARTSSFSRCPRSPGSRMSCSGFSPLLPLRWRLRPPAAHCPPSCARSGWTSPRPCDSPRPQASRLVSYGLAGAALVVATLAALSRALTILDLATYALVIAAVGLFPAVLAALWWKRANAYGAAGAMLVGLGVALLYFVGTHYFAVPLAEASWVLGNGGTEAFEYFVELKDAWMAAPAGPAKDAAWTALDAYARGIAPWWGIVEMAIALLALPAGLLTLVVVSLLTPAPRAAATVP